MLSARQQGQRTKPRRSQPNCSLELQPDLPTPRSCPPRIVPAAHCSPPTRSTPGLRRTSPRTAQKNRKQLHTWLLAVALCYAVLATCAQASSNKQLSINAADQVLRALFSQSSRPFCSLQACTNSFLQAILRPAPSPSPAWGRWPFTASPDARRGAK